MSDEAEIILGVEDETTAATLSRIFLYLINTPLHLERLQAEWTTVIPFPRSLIPNLSKIEQLPFLPTIISEGLRISYGVTTRTPLIAPNETLRYGGFTIPPGTPVSMANDILPDPETFKPQRWLENIDNQNLEKYQVALTKGSRQCLGMSLAYAELWIIMATLWSRFDFELFETTVEDVKWEHDFFTTFPEEKSIVIRVTIKNESR